MTSLSATEFLKQYSATKYMLNIRVNEFLIISLPLLNCQIKLFINFLLVKTVKINHRLIILLFPV